jgi:hypothetical protein
LLAHVHIEKDFFWAQCAVSSKVCYEDWGVLVLLNCAQFAFQVKREKKNVRETWREDECETLRTGLSVVVYSGGLQP